MQVVIKPVVVTEQRRSAVEVEFPSSYPVGETTVLVAFDSRSSPETAYGSGVAGASSFGYPPALPSAPGGAAPGGRVRTAMAWPGRIFLLAALCVLLVVTITGLALCALHALNRQAEAAARTRACIDSLNDLRLHLARHDPLTNALPETESRLREWEAEAQEADSGAREILQRFDQAVFDLRIQRQAFDSSDHLHIFTQEHADHSARYRQCVIQAFQAGEASDRLAAEVFRNLDETLLQVHGVLLAAADNQAAAGDNPEKIDGEPLKIILELHNTLLTMNADTLRMRSRNPGDDPREALAAFNTQRVSFEAAARKLIETVPHAPILRKLRSDVDRIMDENYRFMKVAAKAMELRVQADAERKKLLLTAGAFERVVNEIDGHFRSRAEEEFHTLFRQKERFSVLVIVLPMVGIILLTALTIVLCRRLRLNLLSWAGTTRPNGGAPTDNAP